MLSHIYPWLQTSFEIGERGVERLKYSLNFGVAPIWQYGNLAYGRAHEPINDDSFCDLIRIIDSKPEGNKVAIDIMYMKIHPGNCSIGQTIISAAQKLLLNYQFDKDYNRADRMDYEMSVIIRVCLNDDEAEEKARLLCTNLFSSYKNYYIPDDDYKGVIKAIASMQPEALLDAFLSLEDFDFMLRRIFTGDFKPFTDVEDDIIISWCEVNPRIRYPLAASIILPFYKMPIPVNWNGHRIANAYDAVEVIKVFTSSFRPNSWSGSRADIMQKRLPLISYLKTHEESSVSDWAAKEELSFRQEIESWREWDFQRIEHESFE